MIKKILSWSFVLFVMPAMMAEGRMLTEIAVPHIPGELIITFDEHITPDVQIEHIRDRGGVILKRFQSSNSVLARFNDSADFFEVHSITNDNEVVNVGLNRIFSIHATPNDPSFRRQYHHKNIKAEQAWDLTTGSSNIVVAVIDTGVDYNHADLRGNYWLNPGETGQDSARNDKRTNGIDDDGNGYIDDWRGWDFANNDNDPMDDQGHGTHCAGLIGAKGNNAIGVTGVNWDVSIVGLKFLKANGEGTIAAAIEAVEYATTMGFDLTSNSWGGDASDSEAARKDLLALEAAIEAAGKKGYLFIAAAGNNGRNTDGKPTFPASLPSEYIISVAASDSNDRLASFSNFGKTTVDLMAPGSSVYSTGKGFFGAAYTSLSGTSMAAPIVAGAAALIKSYHPNATALEIKARILESVDPIRGVSDKLLTGGRLNVYKALQ